MSGMCHDSELTAVCVGSVGLVQCPHTHTVVAIVTPRPVVWAAVGYSCPGFCKSLLTCGVGLCLDKWMD